MDLNKIRNTTLKEYSEELAIEALATNLEVAAEAENARFENNEEANCFTYDQITITVNGVAHGFYLGGPQMAAMYCFMQHICEENLYNFEELTDCTPAAPEASSLTLSLFNACEAALAEEMKRRGITTGDTTMEQSRQIDKALHNLTDVYSSIINQNSPVKTATVTIEEVVSKDFEVTYSGDEDPVALAIAAYKAGEFVVDNGKVSFRQCAVTKPSTEATEWTEF